MAQKPTPPPLQRLLDLQLFLQNFHYIERVTHHPGPVKRQETDTEHTFSLAMVGWYIAQYFPELDRNKVIRYALIHDLVEIYAGDTYIYADQTEIDSKAQREHEALVRIKKEWPDFSDMTSTIEAYERHDDNESKFIYALDKIMPVIMIFLGKGYTWQQEQITLASLLEKKKDKVAVSSEIDTHYFQDLIKLLQEHEHYFTGKKS